MSLKEDSYYISEVLSGNTSAYAKLVERYQSLAYTLALRMVKNSQDAEEIAQDAFVKAYASLKNFRGKSKFSTWLYRIIYNTSISMLRKKQVEMVKIDEKPEFTFNLVHHDNLNEENEFTLKALEKALEILDADERFLITLYYYKDVSVDEISEITGLSSSNVKVKLFRSRKKLHEKLLQLQVNRPILN
jgi:RNA polymerase sigma factor (sigma-70 family)